MSGLAGAVYLGGRPAGPDVLARVVAAAPYTATEGVTTWQSGVAALVRFNQASTPEAVNERQPLVDDEAGLVVVFDGRLDNGEELLREIGRSALAGGVVSDCALLLAMFKRDGVEVVQQLVGDYAFAIWQARERRLFCARSPLGWRPFLWHVDGTRLAFATEPKVLIEGFGVDRRLNEGAIGECMALRFSTPTETFWQDVHRLVPGSALVLETDRVRLWHWHRGPFPDTFTWSEQEHRDQFRRLFDQAITACMRSSTEVACDLSGGLDSSSVTCRAVELFRTGHLGSIVRPVSVRFPGQPHDEGDWIRAVEAHLGIEAAIVLQPPYDWDAARAWSADTLQLPLRPNALGAAATIQRLRSEGIRVLLTGEGGDDWLGGTMAHWPDLARHGRFGQLWREGMQDASGRPFLRRLGSLAINSMRPWISRRWRRQLAWPHLDLQPELPSWIRREWATRIGLRERARSAPSPVALTNFAQQHRYSCYVSARHHVNVDSLLTFAASQHVELRHPFHDLRLTRYLVGAPGHLFRRKGQRKYLLREAMRGVLPEIVRTRTTKAEFSAPATEALTDWVSERSLSRLWPVRMGWVDEAALSRTLAEHQAWRPGSGTAAPGESIISVWLAVAIDLWLEHAYQI